MAAPSVIHVPDSMLFLSEPPPQWFGNDPNPRNAPGWTNRNWLKSRFHTNFAEHTGGRNNIGVLRVCNDDLVQPSRGFGTHPHRDAEIATYVVQGRLTHADSMGTKETLGPGSIQFMTAGTGVQHSEFNESATEPLRFIQMWYTPRQRGLPPNYGSYAAPAGPSVDSLRHLVGDVAGKDSSPDVRINTDANIYASRITAGAPLGMDLLGGRQAYILSLEHDVSMCASGKELKLEQHDAALVTGPAALEFAASEGGKGAHVLVIEMSA
jgi:quercetin 2,3-dioxygenase